MDRFIVRIVVILINIYIPIVLIKALDGVDVSNYDYLFGNTLLLGVVLTVLSHSQGKYHCVWIRGLCYNAIVVPLINFADTQFFLFDDAMILVYSISCAWSVFVILTLYLSVRHFYKVRKLLKKKHELHKTDR